MSFRIILFIALFFSVSGCTSDPEREKYKKDNERQTLLSLATNQNLKADCVYCSNTQAFQGSCSCYTNIPVFTCQGIPSGKGKSNSYKISCANLTSKGIWTVDGGGNSSCSFLTCPPEAYQSAFTAGGE